MKKKPAATEASQRSTPQERERWRSNGVFHATESLQGLQEQLRRLENLLPELPALQRLAVDTAALLAMCELRGMLNGIEALRQALQNDPDPAQEPPGTHRTAQDEPGSR